MSIELVQRRYNAEKNAFSKKIPPLVQHILCGRGIYTDEEIDFSLSKLPPPDGLPDINKAAVRLAKAIENQEKIIIVGDYDVDGACSAALALRVFRKLDAQNIEIMIPDRHADGYGLNEELVRKRILGQLPALILTVDNGIKSHQAVALLQKSNTDVIISDHHNPTKELPPGYAIINPKRQDSSFASTHLAGVGVCFYLLCRLRRILIQRQYFLLHKGTTPLNMAQFLDLVAIGTIADVVPMDRTNRILVEQGLIRIRRGQASCGIRALLEKQEWQKINSEECRFSIVPQLNAVGRLCNMELGIRCLTTDSLSEAQDLATSIRHINEQRKRIASTMKEQAQLKKSSTKTSICLYDERWHLGLTGPLAATLRDQHNCPAIVFAKNGEDFLTGSGRSLKGICLDTLLSQIDKENEGLLLRFGGHSQAVGLTISVNRLKEFEKAYRDHIKQIPLSHTTILTDGELSTEDINLQTATLLLTFAPWGKDFSPPLFTGDFTVVAQNLTSKSHLKLQLRYKDSDTLLTAFKFFHSNDLPSEGQCVQIAYGFAHHSYSRDSFYLKIEHLHPLQ